ncbi:MAG: DUF2147 domain-containing protein [Pseudomonadota bacterium]
MRTLKSGKQTRSTSLMFLVGLILSFGTINTAAATIEGQWQRPESDGGTIMNVKKCGGFFCVYVGSGKHTGQLTGKLRYASERYYTGTLTDLRDGRSYSGKADLSRSGHRLKVSGCVLKFICLGETWRRK